MLIYTFEQRVDSFCKKFSEMATQQTASHLDNSYNNSYNNNNNNNNVTPHTRKVAQTLLSARVEMSRERQS